MSMRILHMTERTRWLIASGLMFVWLFGYSVWSLYRYGYSLHHWPWWLTCAAGSAAVGLLVGWVSVLTSRPMIATQREVVAGLDDEQRRQVGRAWKRGPIPDDPAVLIVVLRRCDLAVQYRRRTLRVRCIVAVFIGVRVFAAILTNLTRHSFQGTAAVLGFWGLYLLALFWPEIGGRLRRPRLMQLRAAANEDPDVSAAVADVIAPAPQTQWRWWLIALVVIVALAYGGLLGVAYHFSPKQRGCRVAQSVVHEIYSNRAWFWSNNIGPAGRTLADYQHLAQQIHDDADGSEQYPDVSPHARRIADLADQAAAIVATSRQQGDTTGPGTLRHNQDDYVHVLDAIANEEKPLVQACQQ